MLDVRLIYDNDSNALHVPAAMGTPAVNQLRGSPVDNLVELAGRVCYDSLGKGRSSGDYHQHIRDVGHLSVLEHAVFTVEVSAYSPLQRFLNRPSLWVDARGAAVYRVTLNLRHVTEWERGGDMFGDRLGAVASKLAPLASPSNYKEARPYIKAVPPGNDREVWASLYIGGVSRGLTHELVRHGDYTAISQRSTRYCDESESPWVWHPVIAETFGSACYEGTRGSGELDDTADVCRRTYDRLVAALSERGVERKAARGAARGVLGNALATELIFSANLAQWRHIIALRIAPAADGEIRRWAGAARDVLRQRFGGDVIP